MIAARSDPARRRRPAQARPARAAARRAGQARVALVREGREGRRPGRVAPCGLTRSAASSSTWTGRWCTAAPTSGRGRCPGRFRCWRRSGRRGGRWCCSRTAATSAPEAFAAGLRENGLPVADDELLTPVCSALDVPGPAAPGAAGDRVRLEAMRERMAAAGVPLLDTEAAEVVFVAHVEDVYARPDGGGGPRGVERREAADGELPARLLGSERDHLQPRRDGDRRDRPGHRRPPDRGRQAVAGGGGRDQRAARGAARRRWP